VTADRRVQRSVGWLTLLIAASAALVLWLRVSQYALGLAIFCDWTRDCSAILWANAPFYLAMLGMVAPLIPVSLALHRRRVGPRFLRAASIVTGAVAVVLALVAVAAAYDQLWANYVGPFGLDVPRRIPKLPAEVGSTSWAAWPTLAGAWTALTSVQLLRANVPVALLWATAVGVYFTAARRATSVA
jgi:hypothetical protein